MLRLAELELYTPLWSARILDEMTRDLIDRQVTEEQADRIERAMRGAFEEAEVDAAKIERLEPAMTVNQKNRLLTPRPSSAGLLSSERRAACSSPLRPRELARPER